MLKKIVILLMIAVFVPFKSCYYNYYYSAPEITDERAAEIARAYFQEQHGLPVTIKWIDRRRRSQYSYRNFIKASHGNDEYELYLNKDNQPAGDNVSATEIVKNADADMLGETAARLGLTMLHEPVVSFDFQYERYTSYVSYGFREPPVTIPKDGLYALLCVLKDQEIDEFVLSITPPQFLGAPGAYNNRISGEVFMTDMTFEDFEKAYDTLARETFWDEQKLNGALDELVGLGYRSAYFYIKSYNAAVVELALYCEAGSDLSDEQAAAILKKIDGRYFRLPDRRTKYTLECVRV